MKQPYHQCDCGQAADKRDGSGWSCAECRRVVSAAQAMIEEHIRKKRSAENEEAVQYKRIDWARGYRAEHREELRIYHRAYRAKRRAKGPKADVAFNHFVPSCNVRTYVGR